MLSRYSLVLTTGFFIARCLPISFAAANEFAFECAAPPTCGKVCKLVCEKKKLTAICFGCECDDICIPARSRQGCKHCATCYGECAADACAECQDHPPQCEFCWRDWFACGCAKPRTVKVLTKYQAEKEIGWYHWEVVDAACCDSVATNGDVRDQYKPAPPDAEIGDIVAVSEEEWAELGPVLMPEQKPSSVQVADQVPIAPTAEPATVSIAERIERLFKK